MEDHCSTRQLKRAELTEASTPTISKRPRPDVLEESPLLLRSLDSSKKIDVPSASGANSKPSASSTPENGNNYYVFLSFRGRDTRNGFVDHLYHRLNDVGLLFHPNFVFRDDRDLPSGEKIGENLISAIKHSKVSIPIISENYAASKWCLRELIQIMECVDRGEQKVLPVLYKVKPYEVRHLGGSFAEAFKSCKDCFDEEVKLQGPVALRKALDHKVFESEKFANGREGELVKELVRVIMDEQQQDFLPPLPRNLVGIDDRVVEVMKLVDTDPSETQIIGICGIGGIGKTTLAKNIYNKLAKKFERRSFLMDIRETINCNGMEHVQNLLISDITGNHGSSVRDSTRGIANIRSSCDKKKVLILLDDVGHRDHLDKLIGGCNFGSGSRIIMTCRDKALLKSEYKCYELEEMNDKDSMLLFCLYAFGAKQPPIELTTLSGDIVATTGGLPLALEIIGSFLKRKDKSIWIETLEKLRKVPHKDVQEKLKISYNSLIYEEQQMFQDIACFFIGIDKRMVTYLWKDPQLYPNSGLARMIELSLIKYGDNNELRMHDQLRDLGRALACPVDKNPRDCSRLWDERAMKILGRKEENENIEALRLDERGSIEFMEQESFKKMPNLKFLHVKDVDFYGDFEGSLAQLRWLKWEGHYHIFKATNVHLEKLVMLDLSCDDINGNGIREYWRGWSSIKMERLEVLNLSGSFLLQSTPNLSVFKNLEMLILEQCSGLKVIDPSIGDVKRLVSLNLSLCGSLKKLPEQLGKLENLEELVIDETGIKEIPPCIGSLKKLKTFSARSCWQLIEVPNSIIRLLSLSLAECCKLQPIPSSIGMLGELVELDLSTTRIQKLPESIRELNKLKILNISKSWIKRLPSSIGKLQSLQELLAYGCKLEGQIHVDKGGLSSLKTLALRCTNISGLPENLDQLSSLEHLDLLNCDELHNELPSLSHLKHLQKLKLLFCKSLQSIPELPSCIQTLHVQSCPKLERLPILTDLGFLSTLMLMECSGLKKLDGLEDLKSLRELHLSLYFDKEADKLLAIEGLEKLGSLEVLDISGRKHIQVLDLSKSEHLKRLIVQNCKSLVEIRCPSKFLEYFDRDGCESLKKFPDFLPPDRPRKKWL
ncbi:hypothetical protein ACJRO7_013558 [Eucalyptus globulus]|uniref:TIR domain-containing protein n=1 Tax=Eucalyptus globulus TaxID=34317 RepID=A0ABD3KY63_EUCGL